MTDKPMSAERLRHIKDHYERWGEAALERTCGELLAEIDRRGAALDDGELFKNIQRVLDEHSAWIARPSNDVTKAIAIVAGIWGSRYAEAAERQRDEALAALEKARADALEEAKSACLDLTGSDATPTLRPGARMCVRRIDHLKDQTP